MQREVDQIKQLKDEHLNCISLLESWVNINTHFLNLKGLDHFSSLLISAFKPLKAECQILKLRPRSIIDKEGNVKEQQVGNALRWVCRPEAKRRIFLGGHMDTVYPESCPFQSAEICEGGKKIRGPGSADMKGGLVILLKALEAFERSGYAKEIGWEVLINPDEEIGSPCSEPLLVEAAGRNHAALIFEPTFIDGSFVSQRKGSANFSVIARGKSSHAGRDFHQGRSAIASMARFMMRAEEINQNSKGITFNIGQIEGGEGSNIVPALSVCRCNIRTTEPGDLETTYAAIQKIIEDENKNEGIHLTLFQETERPPKPFDHQHKQLFEGLKGCAEELGQSCTLKSSGGVCDGNILASHGLPTIDTLGAIGANIHTYEEYAFTDSLVAHAQLAALYLVKIAAGKIAIKEIER